MKKIIFMAALLLGIASYAQVYPQLDTYSLVPINAPANPVEGQVYYDVLSKKVFIWDSLQWVELTDNSLSEADQIVCPTWHH